MASWAETCVWNRAGDLLGHGRVVLVVVLATPQQGGDCTEQTHGGGEGEGLGEPLVEGGRDQVGEELPARQVGGRGVGQVAQVAGPSRTCTGL